VSLIGFNATPDHDHRAWRFSGTNDTLRLLPCLLRQVAFSEAAFESDPDATDSRFCIRLWERAGIDDDGIYGPATDIERLAGLIEAGINETDAEGEFRISQAYAADVEYSLVFVVTPGHASAQTLTQASGAGSAGSEPELHDMKPVQFSFYEIEDDYESAGLLSLTPDSLFLEFWIADEDEDDRNREVKEKHIDFVDIASVTLKPGVFSVLMTLETHNMKSLEGLPCNRPARLVLRFGKKVREEVEMVAAALEAVI